MQRREFMSGALPLCVASVASGESAQQAEKPHIVNVERALLAEFRPQVDKMIIDMLIERLCRAHGVADIQELPFDKIAFHVSGVTDPQQSTEC